MDENLPRAVYDFRFGYDKYPFEHAEFSKRLHRIFKKFVYQKEEGAENGYVHWQGRGSLWKKQRPTNAEDLANAVFDFHTIGDYYFKPTSKPASGNMFYVMKDDTRVDGPWSDKDVHAYVPRQYRVTLYPWQQRILDTADVWDPRSINLVIDPTGNHGKSIVTGVAQCKGFYSFPTNLDGQRLLESVCDVMMAREAREPKLVFFDIPRSQNKKALSSLFTAIEVVKSGIVCDTRYSFKQWMFDSPQIWVFTNEELNLSMLSKDRWKLWEFDAGGDLVPVVPVS